MARYWVLGMAASAFESGGKNTVVSNPRLLAVEGCEDSA
jgi:type II secretory pathway component GspD/PulD (secretin)